MTRANMPRRPRPSRQHKISDNLSILPAADSTRSLKRKRPSRDSKSATKDSSEGTVDVDAVLPSDVNESEDDSFDVDAPRVVQWVDEDDLMEADGLVTVPSPDIRSFKKDLSDLSLGALRKAQNSIVEKEVGTESDSSDDTEDEDNFEADFSHSSEKEKVEWSIKPKNEITKRANKHAPIEITSKRPVTRRRIVVEVKSQQARDPRFSQLAGTFSKDKFRQGYSFLTESHKKELETLRENLKRARKLLASSPRDVYEERADQVHKLERAVKRAESQVDKDKWDKIEQEALEKVKKEERDMRKQGKGEWHMKEANKRKLLMKARYDALASEGGNRAVKKAIEKKQKKIGQKEKRSRPFVADGAKRRKSNLLALIVDVVVATMTDDDQGISGHDIYRGGSPLSPSITNSSISSSSSSSFSFAGGRLETIATVVELAISRWARQWRRETASDTSSSSSSSRSSILTLSRQHRKRIRRRRSAITVQSEQSERDIEAHISLLKAREESRQVPRNFTLYSPSSPSTPKHVIPTPRVFLTTAMPDLLPQLETAVRKVTKAHRHYDRRHVPFTKGRAKRPIQHQDYMLPSPMKPSFLVHQSQPVKPKSWYLDVASPTWEDMRALGKALHLHPLTLEDILHRDPREKLELFPKLGYYFISFRAIESISHKTMEYTETQDDSTSTIGEANVYLVVFKEGICSVRLLSSFIPPGTDKSSRQFHFTNISDWIAHGILDSIVDSFFPLLEEIGGEVAAIEDLVSAAAPYSEIHHHDVQIREKSEKTDILETTSAHGSEFKEKDHAPSVEARRYSAASADVRFSSPRFTVSLALRRLKRVLDMRWRKLWTKQPPRPNPTQIALRRMARTRKRITSLTRLLATKSDVVAQIRKRLMTVNGGKGDDNLDVSMYMGDVQDHILMLQHSLVHYERILSQAHPAYLSQLRTGAVLAKGGAGKSILYLTVVSFAVPVVQPLIGTIPVVHTS
ncbi:hypothetical protein H0H93_007866 [Arthromyces matolae]|nr:hypothetical protein H0H93_007866 [Arthromyces matolae]